jgi:hypothetical protein
VRHGVLFANRSITPTDLKLTATKVAEDRPRAIDGVVLLVVVGTRPIGTASSDIPATIRVWLDYAAL